MDRVDQLVRLAPHWGTSLQSVLERGRGDSLSPWLAGSPCVSGQIFLDSVSTLSPLVRVHAPSCEEGLPLGKFLWQLARLTVSGFFLFALLLFSCASVF